MANVTFSVPDALVAELNQIAVSQGFANAKELVIHFLTETVKRTRIEAATKKTIEAVESVPAIK